MGDAAPLTLLLVEARAEQQPLLAFRGVRCGPHTTFARLMCFTCATGGLCELCERCKAAWTTSGCGARLWPCCLPRASMCGRLGLGNRECVEPRLPPRREKPGAGATLKLLV